MPKMLFQRWYFKHIIWTFVLLVVVTGVLAYYNWMVGLLAFAGIAALAVASLAAEHKFRQETELYLTTLGLRVKRAGRAPSSICPTAFSCIARTGSSNGIMLM